MATMVRFHISIGQEVRNSNRYDARGRYQHSPQRMLDRELVAELAQHFGLTSSEVSAMERSGGAMICCTPESFVRWQVARNTRGAINRFKDLGVHIVDVPEHQTPAQQARELRRVPLVVEGQPQVLDVAMVDVEVTH